MSTPRITAVTIVYHYADGTSRDAIKIDSPQISQAKREELRDAAHDHMNDPVRFLLDVIGDDITRERELAASEIVIPIPLPEFVCVCGIEPCPVPGHLRAQEP
jgi:hypothetical protein